MGLPAATLSALRTKAEAFLTDSACMIRKDRAPGSVTWSYVSAVDCRRQAQRRNDGESVEASRTQAHKRFTVLFPVGTDVRSEDRLAFGVTAFRGEWASGTAYVTGDGVTLNSGGECTVWVALQAGTGKDPRSNSAYWTPAVIDEVSGIDPSRTDQALLRAQTINVR